MKFSIIVPVYRVEPYLSNCINSILSQSNSDFELILVDDGSPDRCGVICDKYAERDARITVIHKRNGGLSSARNVGIDAASGEYILFLDSDDCLAADTFLEQAAEQLLNRQVDVLSFNFRKTYPDREEPCYFREGIGHDTQTLEEMTRNGLWIACAWNKIIRRSLFEEHDLHFIEGITSEDIDWCVRLAFCGESFGYLDVCGIRYLQRESSISNAMTGKKVECLRQNIVRSHDLTQAHGGTKAEQLRTYLAYQVGTLLQSISLLTDRKERECAIEASKPLLPLLNYSNSRKVTLLRQVCRFAGIHGCMVLLRLRNKIR
jgi:glycosyltransferase involved in cell wall biosynthesis